MTRSLSLLVLGTALWGSACVSVQSAYLTNLSVPKERGHTIKATTERTVFLGVNFDNSYAFEAREKLYNACPEGMVTGVLSTYERTNYVLFIKHEVKAEATCAPANLPLAAPIPTSTTADTGNGATDSVKELEQ